MSWISAARTRVRLLFAKDEAESRMHEEIAFHIEMETDRLVREQGLEPVEARRRALVAFGGVSKHQEALRDGRGFAWVSGLSLDTRLGFRMLVKYPGLTIVGGLAMAFAICVGVVTFEMLNLWVNPTLPIPGGERVVQIRNLDLETGGPEERVLHDFIGWRRTVRSVEELGAYRDVTRNLFSAGEARPVSVAEITASAFRIASEPPLLGRTLVEADEQPGAPPVIVLGHDVWKRRFGGDAGVIGRSIQLGDSYPTVVGVMPEGYAFPVSHELWTPLRTEALDRAPRTGFEITVFGRLADGATLESAQAELDMLGLRAAAQLPETHRQLRPRVTPFAKLFNPPNGGDLTVFVAINLFVLTLIVLICGNVALLIFARAATRESELVVRSALGASRIRIVTQLFAEALVLGSMAALIGLGAAFVVLRRFGLAFLEVNLGRLPFWYDIQVSAASVGYAFALTVVASAIAGVVPGIKVTRSLGARIKERSGGGGGLRFGGIWTAVIIAQVAVTVAFPAVVWVEQRELMRIEAQDAGFPAEEYLAALLEMDPGAVAAGESKEAQAALDVRYRGSLEALRQRLGAEPGVLGVTFVDRLPRDYHPEAEMEVADRAAARDPATEAAITERLEEIAIARIDPGYFQVLGKPILAGRGFQAADAGPEARVAIVDRGFVDQVFQGRNAVGRRVRFATHPLPDGTLPEPNPWIEIVGVVDELGMAYATRHDRAAGLYLPSDLAGGGAMQVMVHTDGDPLALAPRLRELTAAVDPTLRITGVQRLDQVSTPLLWILRLWLRITLGATAIALLLSLAGIYAVLSFTVARRTREIGVRVALGASRARVVAAIFRRPVTQVALGVLAGGTLIGAVAYLPPEGSWEPGLSLAQFALLLAYSALMLAVCLLACVVPTRRALGVEPTEALRAE